MNNTYGCDLCKYLSGKHCKLWEVKVPDPYDSHCESFRYSEAALQQRKLNWASLGIAT